MLLPEELSPNTGNPCASLLFICVGNRKGKNLFSDCLLALDAKTGKRLWHFQFVHHDLWDRDIPAPPNLIEVTRGGKKIDAVAQITKQGFVYLFERTTGKPLFEIKEVPVPASALLGEKAWKRWKLWKKKKMNVKRLRV